MNLKQVVVVVVFSFSGFLPSFVQVSMVGFWLVLGSVVWVQVHVFLWGVSQTTDCGKTINSIYILIKSYNNIINK